MSDPARGVQPQRLRQLLRRMVDIYSPSGKEEEILDFLHGYLKRHGLPVVRQPVDDSRHNLVVAPQGGEIQLALIGHVDTVAAFDLDHYGYEEQGDQILGLGTSVYSRRGLSMEGVESFRSHSDANELWAAGVKPLLLGPGQLEKAHAPDESVSFEQVCLAAEIYLELLTSLWR